MDNTKIAWTDATWNPLRGCSRVSEGCRNCYAERMAARFSKEIQAQGSEGKFMKPLPYHGLATMTKDGPRWTGEVRFIEKMLDAPLHWKKPRRIFVNSTSDLFHKEVSNEWLDRIFAVMALAPRHTFQILTKRAERMLDYFQTDPYQRILAASNEFDGKRDRPAREHVISDPNVVPWKHVYLGVSVENQAAADERIPLLLQTPAAVRWISAEPLLGPLDLSQFLPGGWGCSGSGSIVSLDWVVVGGESGPGARPFDLAWARSIRDQCKASGTACFVKQIGAWPVYIGAIPGARFRLEDRAGGDMAEWLEDLRVREYPASA